MTELEIHSRLRSVEESVIRLSEKIKNMERAAKKIEEKRNANKKMILGGFVGFSTSAAIIIFEYIFKGKN